MPAVSQAQFKYFQMLKHNPKRRKKEGVSQKVANEFTQSTNYGDLPKKISKKIK